MHGFSGLKWGKGWYSVDPNELVFTFWGFYICANFGEYLSRNATIRVHTGRYTDTLTDTNWFYNLSHAICYIYGADKRRVTMRLLLFAALHTMQVVISRE